LGSGLKVLIAVPQYPHVTEPRGTGIDPEQLLVFEITVPSGFFTVDAAHPGDKLPSALSEGSHIRYI
jgi:hypothetical protein